jgi:hypothetical protein
MGASAPIQVGADAPTYPNPTYQKFISASTIIKINIHILLPSILHF